MKMNNNMNSPILSIGMIVKNEEKSLRRCLNSLLPLIESISCELIIADTGSTDSTFEIAKEYTAKVYHYKWNDDFASARNSTLKKASGLWYFYLDADEYLDSQINDIINFFSDITINSKYNSACIILKNYHDRYKKRFSEVRLPRFHRIDENTSFSGRIHEIINEKKPMYYFSSVLHHTGYAEMYSDEFRKKRLRNMKLLRLEYSENPENLRALCHIIDSSIDFPDERKKYIDESLLLIKNNHSTVYCWILYMIAADYYSFDVMKSIAICEEYLQTRNNNDIFVTSVAIHLIKARAMFLARCYESSIDEYVKYIELYTKYRNNILDCFDMICHNIIGITEKEFHENIIAAINSFLSVRKYDYTKKLMTFMLSEQIDDDNFVVLLEYIQIYLIENNDCEFLIKCICRMSQNNNVLQVNYFWNTIEIVFIKSDTMNRKKIADTVVATVVNSNFTSFMNIVSMGTENETNSLLDFIRNLKDCKSGCIYLFYCVLKNNVDLSVFINSVGIKDALNLINLLSDLFPDFSEIVADYVIAPNVFENIRSFKFIIDLYYFAVLKSEVLFECKKNKLYSAFVSMLKDYIMNIYNPDLLNDDDTEVLPELHRFGYYLIRADGYLKNQNHVLCLEELKKAFRNCESMGCIVKYYLKKMM